MVVRCSAKGKKFLTLIHLLDVKGSDESSITPVMVLDWGGCVVVSLCLAMQFCPRDFALPSLVASPVVCPLPPVSWLMVGPCVKVNILILHCEFSVACMGGR